MTVPDRSPGGRLMVGQGPAGGVYHVAAGGRAACSGAVPIAAPVTIGRARATHWCQRKQCRRHLRGEAQPRRAAAADVEHVCPGCYVERAATVRPCPSCGSTYAAVPETAAG